MFDTLQVINVDGFFITNKKAPDIDYQAPCFFNST